MKLKSFLAMMAVAFLATGFTSCDDDDDDDAAQSVNLSGDFYGAAGMTVQGSTSYDSTCVARVIAQGNGKYSVVLPETTDKNVESAKMPSMPTITLKDLELKETAKNIYSTEIASLVVKEVSPSKDATISNLKISLDNSTKKISLSYGLQYGKMPLTIAYDFKTLTKNDFVVGDFFGNNIMTVDKDEMPDNGVTASIALQKDGKYAITLPAAANQEKAGMSMPAVTLTDIEISESANTYAFEIAELSVPVNQKNYLFKNIKGNIHGNNFTLSYSLKPGAMPLEIMNNFVGAKVAK